jgi:hypothetical protein
MRKNLFYREILTVGHISMIEEKDSISDESIQKKVETAICLLKKNDVFLLQNNVNERSISHKLAEYLQAQFKSWHVDCEYNRDNARAKSLNLPKRNAPDDDLDARTVFPDIIVHHRNTSENLLVIEIKKSNNSEDDKFDRKKIKAFIKDLKYKYGLFIKFQVASNDASYKIKWF